MRTRKKQPAVTKRRILEAAGEEFARHGYAGTGLDAIVTRAELTKGALFHHFSDKRAMAVAWIEEVLAPSVEERWIAPVAELASLDAVKGFFRARCLEMETTDATSAWVTMTAGASIADDVLAASLDQVFTAWREALAVMLERGKSEGWIHRSIQPAAEAVFLVSAIAGFCLTARSAMNDSARRGCAAAIEAYLETLRAQ
jgi:AcrR family transcriptional regulator